ncbi:nuclear transport factor 2 family protein [Mycolicibacterium sp. XJ1819]
MTDGISQLLDREEIRDVIYRYARGIDRRDFELVRQCYHPDGIDRHPGFTGARDDYIEWLRNILPRYAFTVHFVGNVLVETDGDEAAAESYTVAYHASAEDVDNARENFIAGIRYADRFTRNGRGWRIAERTVITDWVQPWQPDRRRAERFAPNGGPCMTTTPTPWVLPHGGSEHRRAAS